MLSLVTADVLVCEGGKPLGLMPRIILADDEVTAWDLAPKLALAVYGKAKLPGVPTVNDPAALARIVVEKGFFLPGLDCGACGREDCRSLAKDILAGRGTSGDCASRRRTLTVTSNGQPLALNKFVEGIIGAGFRAMLAELKGFTPGRVEISLEI